MMVNGYFYPDQSATSDAFPCPRCGVLIWSGTVHECQWTLSPPPNVPVSPYMPTHEHVWAYCGADAMYVYLVCQCGATKRSVPE